MLDSLLSFSDFLIERKVITSALRDDINQRCQVTGEDFGHSLLESGMVQRLTPLKLAEYRSEHLQMEFFWDTASVRLDQAATDVYRENFPDYIKADNLVVVQPRIGGDRFLLVDNPHSASYLAVSATVPGNPLKLKSPPEEILVSTTDAINGLLGSAINDDADHEKDENMMSLVNDVLLTALHKGWSDIHIIPKDTGDTLIKVRDTGILKQYRTLPISHHDKLINVIATMADLDTSKKDLEALDGGFSFSDGSTKVDIRFASIPSVFGCTAVLRIFTPSSAPIPQLDMLGHTAENIDKLSAIKTMPFGIIFITGPTGSGKSTTMHSVLSTINASERKIMTAEDPVERKLRVAVQVPVAGKITFDRALTSFLRQDPDVILVGETRDQKTAEKAVEAALTGHLVLTTVHANRAAEVAQRIGSLKVDRNMFIDAFKMAVAQKLVKKLCTCAVDVDLEDELERLVPDETIKEVYRSKFPSKIKALNPHPCRECEEWGGYKGRQVISEVMEINKKIASGILKQVPASEIESLAEESGFVPIIEHARILVEKGTITLSEFIAATGGYNYDHVKD